MKSLFLSIVALVTATSFASELVGDFPKVQFGSVFVSVEEVCVDGDNIHTQYAVPVCVKWSSGEAGGCAREVNKFLSTPINYTKEIPNGEGSFKTISMSIPLHYNIPFGFWTEAGISSVKVMPYSIPGCEF